MGKLDLRLNKIEDIISDENFRKNKGLSNEVGYYVFDYPATEELRVRDHIKELEDRWEKNPRGYKLKVFDFYDIMIDLIEEEGLLETSIETEENEGLDYLIDAVNDLLQVETNDNYFNAYIEENTPDNSIVFITGVGKIFPFTRSHKILNRLHLVFNRAPVVLFYPGIYDGQSLILFSEFKDDNYYRALPLVK